MRKTSKRKSRTLKTDSPTIQRQAKFIHNVTSQKFSSPRKAMIAAGYSEATPVASVLSRPLVKSALTEAMTLLGISHKDIVSPIKRALTATRSYINNNGEMVKTQIPDHKYQLEASRDAVAIFGGIPKVGEGTPNAHGLNLFIAIDNQGGTRVETSTHAMRSAKTISVPAQENPRVVIQVQDQGPRNRQAGQPDPALND